MSKPTEPAPNDPRLEPRRSSSGNLRLVFLILVAALALLGVRALSRSIAPREKVPFDDRGLRALRAAQPDIVFLGNSWLFTRLQPRIVGELVPDKRVSFLGRSGSRSSQWYLFLKNEVIASEVRPERVVVVFRGAELTDAFSRTTSQRHRQHLERSSHEDEPVLRRILERRPPGALGGLQTWAAHQVPTDRLREGAWRPIQLGGLGLSELFEPASADESDGNRTSARMARINGLFNLAKLRQVKEGQDIQAVDDRQLSFDFDASVEGSFLPELIRLARLHDIELLFVRIQTRNNSGDWQESERDAEYNGKLGAYLEANGVGYRDLRYDNWAPREWYRDSGHIKKDKKQVYTRAFVEHVPEAFD